MTMTVSIPGHSADCLCVPCMMADMDAHLAAKGVNPSKYSNGNGEDIEPQRTRYAAPGTRAGRGTVRLVSAAQVRYIKSLLAERDTSNLVRLPGSENVEKMSLAGARDLIDRLLSCPVKKDATVTKPNLATEKQIAYALALSARKLALDAEGVAKSEELYKSMTKREISIAIDSLRAMPDAPVVKQTEAEKRHETVEAGIYLLDGVVHKVQRAVHGSGNLYAKELNRETGRFEYASGAIRRLRPEHRMSLEQAKEFGSVYGMCCACGATLTDEKSIEAGIGPVCATKF